MSMVTRSIVHRRNFTITSNHDGLMLDLRRRRWPPKKPALAQRLVFAGILDTLMLNAN